VPAAICQGCTTIARTARAAKNGTPTCGSSCKKQDGECWQLVPLFVRPWHIAAALARYAKVGEVATESSKIRRIWRTCFYIDGCAIVRTVALKWPIFKQKKGCTTISIGLNYCSIGSSQPPSRDTVP
jgi:hypothetical protein